MMDPPAFETLLDECAWLRRLARHLVDNPSDAEDVAQEAWLAAAGDGAGLARRRPSRGWLRVVARRAASNRRRSERRRADRERLAAADEGGSPTGEELVERLELTRRVARALQELPEPYRRTLYLRYYEGLEARVIAERENIPAGTVRWRAQRGRELLRDALTRDGTTWNQWAGLLAPFAGLPAVPTAGGAIPWVGGIAMSMQWTVIGALAGAMAAGATWFAREPLAAGQGTGLDLVAETDADVDPEPNPDGVSAPAANRSTRTPAAPDASALDPRFGVIGYGQVTDVSGAPVSNAQPVFEDREARLATGGPGPNGAWSLVGLLPGAHTLVLEVAGYVPYREEVEVPAQAKWRHDVVLQRGRRIPVRFENAAGEALTGRLGRRGLAALLCVVATRERPQPRLVGVRGRIAERYGVGRFDARAELSTAPDLDLRYQGVLHVNAAPPVWVSAVCRDAVLETRSLSGTEDELVFVIDEDALEALRGEVRVRLVDHRGAAILDGVSLEHPSGGIRISKELEGNQLVFRAVPPGQLELRLGRDSRSEDGNEALELVVEIPPGELVDLGTIRLAERAPFSVKVVDPAGALLPLTIRALHFPPGAEFHDLGDGTYSRADDEGLQRVSIQRAGPKLLQAGGEEGYARVALEVDTERESTFELVVPSGTEVVIIGAREQGQAVVLEGKPGLPLYSGLWIPRVVYLAPGSYSLTRFSEARPVGRMTFQVGTERTVVRWSDR